MAVTPKRLLQSSEFFLDFCINKVYGKIYFLILWRVFLVTFFYQSKFTYLAVLIYYRDPPKCYFLIKEYRLLSTNPWSYTGKYNHPSNIPVQDGLLYIPVQYLGFVPNNPYITAIWKIRYLQTCYQTSIKPGILGDFSPADRWLQCRFESQH